MPKCCGCTCTIDIDMDTYSGYDGVTFCDRCKTPDQAAQAQLVQWLGEDAVKAARAYEAGDYDTLKACLETIQAYAKDLGFRPDQMTEEDV